MYPAAACTLETRHAGAPRAVGTFSSLSKSAMACSVQPSSRSRRIRFERSRRSATAERLTVRPCARAACRASRVRAEIVSRCEDYAWSSYHAHGLGAANELLDPLTLYEELSPYPAIRQRKWADKVHLPIDGKVLAAIRRSSATGLPYGAKPWVNRLASRLNLDLTIRKRGSLLQPV